MLDRLRECVDNFFTWSNYARPLLEVYQVWTHRRAIAPFPQRETLIHPNTTTLWTALSTLPVGSRILLMSMGVDGISTNLEFWNTLILGYPELNFTLLLVVDVHERSIPALRLGLYRGKYFCRYSGACLAAGLRGEMMDPHTFQLLYYWHWMCVYRGVIGNAMHNFATTVIIRGRNLRASGPPVL